MGRIVYFWMLQQPDPEHIGLKDWLQFLDELALATIVCFGVFLLMSLLLYRNAAVRKKIRTPSDVFSSYTPLGWLLLTFLAGVALLAFFAYRYDRLFSESTVSWAGSGARAAMWTALWTFIVAYFLTWTGITPAKFRYRPRGFLYGGRK
jgi:multisubunit Na+/H+ antiporter MnhB subunit